jgi:hypothetical protein
MALVAPTRLRRFIKNSAERLNILDRVGTAPVRPGFRLGALAIYGEAPQVSVIDADQSCSLAGREAAKLLACGWREKLLTMCLQFGGERLGVAGDQLVNGRAARKA